MLQRNADGNIEDAAPVRTGGETNLGAEARVLAREVRRIRDESDSPDLRILAEAILKLGQLVYQGK